MTESLPFDTLQLKKAALVYRAAKHPLRQKMLQFIHKRGRVMVTTVYVHLRMEQSVASQHLAILRKAKLVSTEREGKCIFYSVNYQRLQQVHEVARELAG